MIQTYDPLENTASWSGRLAVLLYSVFLTTSVWATGESIARTTSLPKIFCYIVALAFLAGASFCLAIIHRSLSSGYVRARGLLLVIGLIGFLFLWLISFTSNAHNFYFVSSIDTLRRSEVGEVLDRLTVIGPKTTIAAHTAKEDMKGEIEAIIEKMKSEIFNPGNPGAGPDTEKVLAEIEEILQREVQRLDVPPRRDLAALRKYPDTRNSGVTNRRN